ncbi:hypothetical protein [Paraconexibacter sp. AEG42_29]|uniref:hypothetical protein n=1 Tax=Paraconexibacter sp. AEG42_29 TaxID=2997339 RepID=UPI00339D8F59
MPRPSSADVREQAPHPADGGPGVVLLGGTWFGDVRIQAKRLRERIAEVLRA